jgi:hypothetical protein
MERVRAVAQGNAEVLPNDTLASLGSESAGFVKLSPTAIISFSGLCLVRDASDGVWYMGDLDDDGSITCWSGYGDDLDFAIRSL